MSESETTLREQSSSHIRYLEKLESRFEKHIEDFLLLDSEKCLVLETPDTKVGVWRTMGILLSTHKDAGTVNQIFLNWNDLRTISSPFNSLPKLSRFVLLEISDQKSFKKTSFVVIKKLVQRLKASALRKLVFVTCHIEAFDNLLQSMGLATYLKINEYENKIMRQPMLFNEDTVFRAAASGDADDVVKLLQAGVSVNRTDCDTGSTALHVASEYGHKDVVSILIQNCAIINSVNNENTSLGLAAQRGHEDVVTVLLENEADADLSSCFGDTPLMQATQQGFYNIVVTLIDYDADVNVHNNNGSTALHLAVENGNYIIAYTLLKHGANVNCEDKNHYMPIHYAALHGYADIVRLLIAMEAAIDTYTWEGKTPMDLATEFGHDEIVHQLRDCLEERDVLTQAIKIIKRRSLVYIS